MRHFVILSQSMKHSVRIHGQFLVAFCVDSMRTWLLPNHFFKLGKMESYDLSLSVQFLTAIGGVGFPSYWTYKHRTAAFKDSLDFLNRMVLFQIDEKIAVLDSYISNAANWKANGEAFVIATTDRIASDLTSMSRIKSNMNEDQRIKINEKVIRLSRIMTENGLDTAKIEAVAALLK